MVLFDEVYDVTTDKNKRNLWKETDEKYDTIDKLKMKLKEIKIDMKNRFKKIKKY